MCPAEEPGSCSALTGLNSSSTGWRSTARKVESLDARVPRILRQGHYAWVAATRSSRPPSARRCASMSRAGAQCWCGRAAGLSSDHVAPAECRSPPCIRRAPLPQSQAGQQRRPCRKSLPGWTIGGRDAGDCRIVTALRESLNCLGRCGRRRGERERVAVKRRELWGEHRAQAFPDGRSEGFRPPGGASASLRAMRSVPRVLMPSGSSTKAPADLPVSCAMLRSGSGSSSARLVRRRGLGSR